MRVSLCGWLRSPTLPANPRDRRGAGTVVRTQGAAVFAALPLARVGDGVRIRTRTGTVDGEVLSVERRGTAIAVFGGAHGIAVGDRVAVDPEALGCVTGFGALGRALDARGRPLDGKGPLRGSLARASVRESPSPETRQPVNAPLWTGVRAIDALLTVGRGARVGIFGAAGTGKSSLLEAIARGARSDAVVVALIGERGREAQERIAKVDARTTLLCATGDRSPAERARAAELALTQAAALRAAGLHVTLLFDSLARYVEAVREQRVALREPVGRGGYPPSVWFALARLLERAGTDATGSITLFATVLADSDDERDPLAEIARSLLDGHLLLSRPHARAGRFPAIDVPASVSRRCGWSRDRRTSKRRGASAARSRGCRKAKNCAAWASAQYPIRRCSARSMQNPRWSGF